MAAPATIHAADFYVSLSLQDQLASGFARSMGQFSQFTASLRSMAFAGGALVGSVAAGVVPAIRAYAEFDDQMRAVKAVAGATAAEFAKLTERARELGATTSFTATEVGQGMEALGRAGFSFDEIMSATEHVLNLARATRTDLAEASDIAAKQMRAFGIEAKDMGMVVDILTATTTNSSQTLVDLHEAMKMVAPIARSVGSNILDTAAAIGILADNGLVGTMAGTGLARAYKELSKQAKATQIEELTGVSISDAEGRMRPIADILQEIGRASKDLNDQQRQDMFNTIFGRGTLAAQVMGRSAAEFEDLVAALKSSRGVARQVAREMDAGIGGAMRIARSAVSDLMIEIGKQLAPTLTRLAEVLRVVVGSLSAFVKSNPGVLKAIVAITAGIAGITAALGALGLAMVVLQSLGMMLTAIWGVGAAIASGGLVPILGAIIVAVGTVGAAVVGFGAILSRNAKSVRDMLASINDYFFSMEARLAKFGQVLMEALKQNQLETAWELIWVQMKLEFIKFELWFLHNWEKMVLAMIRIIAQGMLAVHKVMQDVATLGLRSNTKNFMQLWFGPESVFDLGQDEAFRRYNKRAQGHSLFDVGALEVRAYNEQVKLEGEIEEISARLRASAEKEAEGETGPYDLDREIGPPMDTGPDLPSAGAMATFSGFIAQNMSDFLQPRDVEEEMNDHLSAIEGSNERIAEGIENINTAQ